MGKYCIITTSIIIGTLLFFLDYKKVSKTIDYFKKKKESKKKNIIEQIFTKR